MRIELGSIIDLGPHKCTWCCADDVTYYAYQKPKCKSNAKFESMTQGGFITADGPSVNESSNCRYNIACCNVLMQPQWSAGIQQRTQVGNKVSWQIIFETSYKSENLCNQKVSIKNATYKLATTHQSCRMKKNCNTQNTKMDKGWIEIQIKQEERLIFNYFRRWTCMKMLQQYYSWLETVERVQTILQILWMIYAEVYLNCKNDCRYSPNKGNN